MVKGVKKVEAVKGDYQVIKVVIPKKLHRELKVKCTSMDIIPNKVIIACIEKYVKGIEKHIEEIREKG